MGIDRREFLGGTLLASALAACGGSSGGTESPLDERAAPVAAGGGGALRIASVKTVVEGKLLPTLVAAYEAKHGTKIEVTTGTAVYDLARQTKVDLVISHYGHRDAEQFVVDGLGEFPRTFASNQMALVGPAADPAGVRGMTDLGEAFAKIAAARAPFVMNNIDGVRYLTEIAWHLAGKPDRGGSWFHDEGDGKRDAIDSAARLGGYTLWGLTPFLRDDARGLEPLVTADPLLQRMMVSILVKRGPNRASAEAFQTFLLEPETQASIRRTKYPTESGSITWVPGGRHNRTGSLPKSREV